MTKPVRDPEWRRKALKRRLRAIKHDPTTAEPGEVQRLAAEYRRLQQAERAPEPSTPVAPVTGLTAEEAAAVATWPVELKNRLEDAALTRIILPWGRD